MSRLIQTLRPSLAIAAVGALLVACAGNEADADNDTAGAPPASSSAESPEGAALPDDVLALPDNDSGADFATLDAGRYRIPLSDSLSFDVDVPDQTFAHDDGLFLATGAIVLKAEIAGEEYGVPHDPCTAHIIDPAGPTVDDLVQAIRSEPAYQVTRPEPVELGGASGTYLEVRIPRDRDTPRCDGGEVQTPGNPDNAISWKPPYIGSYWILDVDGQRVVVAQSCGPCSSDEAHGDSADVRSISFTPTN